MSQCLQVERACLQQFEKALTVNDPQPCGQKGRALDDSVNTSTVDVCRCALWFKFKKCFPRIVLCYMKGTLLHSALTPSKGEWIGIS